MSMSGYLPSGPGAFTNSRAFAVLAFTHSPVHFVKHAYERFILSLQLSFVPLVLLFYQLPQILPQDFTSWSA